MVEPPLCHHDGFNRTSSTVPGPIPSPFLIWPTSVYAISAEGLGIGRATCLTLGYWDCNNMRHLCIKILWSDSHGDWTFYLIFILNRFLIGLINWILPYFENFKTTIEEANLSFKHPSLNSYLFFFFLYVWLSLLDFPFGAEK